MADLLLQPFVLAEYVLTPAWVFPLPRYAGGGVHAAVFAIGHGSRGRFAFCSTASTAKTALCAVRRLFAAHDKGWTDQCTVSFEREGFTVVAFHATSSIYMPATQANFSFHQLRLTVFTVASNKQLR